MPGHVHHCRFPREFTDSGSTGVQESCQRVLRRLSLWLSISGGLFLRRVVRSTVGSNSRRSGNRPDRLLRAAGRGTWPFRVLPPTVRRTRSLPTALLVGPGVYSREDGTWRPVRVPTPFARASSVGAPTAPAQAVTGGGRRATMAAARRGSRRVRRAPARRPWRSLAPGSPWRSMFPRRCSIR